MNITSTLIYPSFVLILLFVSNPLGQATPIFSWQFTYRFNQSESNYDCVRGEDLLQLWDKFEMREEFSFDYGHDSMLCYQLLPWYSSLYIYTCILMLWYYIYACLSFGDPSLELGNKVIFSTVHLVSWLINYTSVWLPNYIVPLTSTIQHQQRSHTQQYHSYYSCHVKKKMASRTYMVNCNCESDNQNTTLSNKRNVSHLQGDAH